MTISNEARKSGHLESRALPDSSTLSDPVRKRVIKPHAIIRITDASITETDQRPSMAPFLLVEVRKANRIMSSEARVTARIILVNRFSDLMPASSVVCNYVTY